MAPEAEQLRLLLVDDEPKLTEFLRMELEVEGYAVQIAHDGAGGLIAPTHLATRLNNHHRFCSSIKGHLQQAKRLA